MRRMIRRMDEGISWKNAKWHVRRVDQNAISQEMAWEKSGSEDQFHHQFHHGPKDIEKAKRIKLIKHIYILKYLYFSWGDRGLTNRGGFQPSKIFIRGW